MGICLGLLVLAWGLVRLWSVPLAVGMSMIAMLLPPIAAVSPTRAGTVADSR